MSDLQDTLEIIIAKCEDEIEECKKGEPEDAFEYGILEGRKEFAEYIVDFANEALATHTKMLRRGEANEETTPPLSVWDEPLKESTTKVLATLTPREENILREKFGIGKGEADD